MTKKLFRSEREKMLGGVCGGLAIYFNVDVVLVRLLWVLAVFLGGSGIPAYIIAWIIIPAGDSLENSFSKFRDEGTDTEGATGSDSGSKDQGNMMAGLIVIAIGVFFLAKQFMPYFPWGKLWPIVLIIVGIVIMARGMKR